LSIGAAVDTWSAAVRRRGSEDIGITPGDVGNPTVGMEMDVIPMSDANSRNKCPVPTVHESPGVR